MVEHGDRLISGFNGGTMASLHVWLLTHVLPPRPARHAYAASPRPAPLRPRGRAPPCPARAPPRPALSRPALSRPASLCPAQPRPARLVLRAPPRLVPGRRRGRHQARRGGLGYKTLFLIRTRGRCRTKPLSPGLSCDTRIQIPGLKKVAQLWNKAAERQQSQNKRPTSSPPAPLACSAAFRI